MKKLFLFVAVLQSAFVGAQVIDKGDIVIQAGGGLGIYHWQLTDLTTNTPNERDTSASWVFPVNIEYGVNRWLGAGLNFTYHNFITNDSLYEVARVIDIVPTAHLHIPWGLKKFDFSVNVGFGYAKFHYEANDPAFTDNPTADAGGTVLILGVNPRLYFKEDGHIALTGWYRYSKYNFKKGRVEDNTGSGYDFSLEGPSNAFGLGLIFKI
jgi:hypothetical protein